MTMRPPRLLLAALALGVVAIVIAYEIVASSIRLSEVSDCAAEFFGVVVGASTTCVRPVGGQLALTAAALATAVVFAIWPRAVAKAVAVVSGLAAAAGAAALLAERDVVSATTIAVALLGSIPFLVFPPSGPNGSPIRRLWIAAVAISVLLGVADVITAGVVAAAGPQVGYFVVAIVIAAAGRLATALQAREAGI